jgi:chemotaxis protein methyltransferase CheR
MNDQECVAFLQWCLPELRFRWKGFRKVRTQVCKRIARRLTELGLSGLDEYKKFLSEKSQEWEILDSLCYATISRFYRDRKVFLMLQDQILPALVQQNTTQGENEVRCWSIGCASGEEAYTLQILWKEYVQPQLKKDLAFRIMATDTDLKVLERAKMGCYEKGSLRELQEELGEDLIKKTFTETKKGLLIKDDFKENIEFIKQDIRKELPDGLFHLILCRNLVFTYFDEDLQREILPKIIEKLHPKGFLVIGSHESLPQAPENLIPIQDSPPIFQFA